MVTLQGGTYAVASVFNTTVTSVTNSGPGTTWTVVAGTVTQADVGRYVIGAGIDGQAPKILTVGTGSFTTDIAPGSGITTGAITIVAPGSTCPMA